MKRDPACNCSLSSCSSQALEQHKQDFTQEREQLEGQHQSMKENMKETRTEKNKMAAKCQELETVSLLAKLFCAYCNKSPVTKEVSNQY